MCNLTALATPHVCPLCPCEGLACTPGKYRYHSWWLSDFSFVTFHLWIHSFVTFHCRVHSFVTLQVWDPLVCDIQDWDPLVCDFLSLGSTRLWLSRLGSTRLWLQEKKCLSFVTNGDRNVSIVLFCKKCLSQKPFSKKCVSFVTNTPKEPLVCYKPNY